ncbi:LuxR C-terminal-related transcriptional regulator [Streptomyces sp. 71268]|uniref:helix-turn-helix transcriptional regulator n=1 Tax=Streptomyces sp. 71268 TaxID=3002640 RepID=UPI0023F7943E|nr:LuxR C-terminal-related transcriptional regulator [Streptomyces sp. 71268]WEV27780.1 LuxR C-terminal-related transcriptional regulator [Streptomyces sp. 71268]
MTTSPHHIDATALGPDAVPHARAPRPAPSAGAPPRRERQPAPQAASAEAEIEQLASLTPLEPAAVEVYAHASRTTSIGLPDLVRLTGRPEDELTRCLQTLLRLRLLRPAQAEPGRLTAVSPDHAELHLVEPAARRIAELQETLTHVRGELTALADRYQEGVAHRLRGQGTEVVTGALAVRRRVAELLAHATRELLAAQPGAGGPQEAPWEPLELAEPVRARGLRVRALYQHTAQFHHAAVDQAEHLADLGCPARTLGDRFARALVVDRQVAVLALRGDPRGAVVVRDPSTVDFVATTFDRLWDQATPFPAKLGRQQAIAASDAVKSDIVRLLVAGEDDKAIARRMGMSVRTCQRHINEILRRLGARNRMRAGYLIHQYETEHGTFDPRAEHGPTGRERAG